jgi:predicted signal transduction protein with EAL and GGDEF domain
VPWAGEAIIVTASFGITQALPGEVNVDPIIARADAALYRAKEDGRNCVRVASEMLAAGSRDQGSGIGDQVGASDAVSLSGFISHPDSARPRSPIADP